MKKKQPVKLLTSMQMKEALVRNKKLRPQHYAIINMDTMFRAFMSFTSDKWLWSKRVTHVLEENKKGKMCEFIKIEYVINDIVKMRFNVPVKSKDPHKHYVVKMIPRNIFAYYKEMTYLELRDFYAKEIALHVVSKVPPAI
jgi:hypothetical protein